MNVYAYFPGVLPGNVYVCFPGGTVFHMCMYAYIYIHIFIFIFISIYTHTQRCLPGDTVIKNPLANSGLIPGLGRSLEAGNGNSLQYSSLENSMGRGSWWATVHRVTKNQT